MLIIYYFSNLILGFELKYIKNANLNVVKILHIGIFLIANMISQIT